MVPVVLRQRHRQAQGMGALRNHRVQMERHLQARHPLRPAL